MNLPSVKILQVVLDDVKLADIVFDTDVNFAQQTGVRVLKGYLAAPGLAVAMWPKISAKYGQVYFIAHVPSGYGFPGPTVFSNPVLAVQFCRTVSRLIAWDAPDLDELQKRYGPFIPQIKAILATFLALDDDWYAASLKE